MVLDVQSEPRGAVRDRILDEASHLFGDRGYGSTSIDAIAYRVGIRKSSLLYHFPSKANLREEVIRRLIVRWKEVIPRLLTAGSSGEDRFAVTIGAVMEYFIADPMRARLCVREAMEHPETLHTLVREHLRPYLGLITDYIRWGQKDHSVHADVDPEAWVIHVLMLIISMVAFAPVTEGMAVLPAEECMERQKAELVRMARRALLCEH